MRRMQELRGSVAAFLLCLSIGCGGGGDGNPDMAPPDMGPAPGTPGAACASDSACNNERCELGHCAEACDSSNVCTGTLVCGTAPNGSRLCVEPCTGTTENEGYMCESGVPTACEHATGPVDCRACGCNASEFCCDAAGCGTEGECVGPRLAVEEPCGDDDWCLSGRCGVPFDGGDPVCLVEYGDPCTTDNCEFCDDDGLGTTYCMHSCNVQGCPSNRTCVIWLGDRWCARNCGFLPGDCEEDNGLECVESLVDFCLPSDD